MFAAWTGCNCLSGSGRFPVVAERALNPFRTESAPLSERDYESLFAYFVEGFQVYKSDYGSRASYPGLPMGEGGAEDQQQESLEGFTRIAPLMAAWIHGGRPTRLNLPGGSQADLVALLRTGLVNGTDRASPGYWGSMTSAKIVEASDVALTVWLSRDVLWDRLDAPHKRKIAAWLYGVNGKTTADNNWHLFVVLVNVVLADLGMPADTAEAHRRYQRFKSFYVGQGWFRDGPEGRVDYYNAWGMHYPLYWIRTISPQWDRGFLVDALAQFSAGFKFMFGPNGIPILGRSVCYRGGVPAPLIMAAADGTGSVSPGEARRAMDLTWRFLVQHGGVDKGTVTQGYCGTDPRIVDYYSGSASCLWSLRSLIAALALPHGSAFWRARGESLPVERGDFVLNLTAIGWRVVGDSRRQDVSIFPKVNEGKAPPRLQEYTWFRRATDAILCRSRRPDNGAAKYDGPKYSSSEPFCGCAAP